MAEFESVRVHPETRRLAGELATMLSEKSGRRVTQADTVHRALECLKDTQERGAWLSPTEAAPLLAVRVRNELVRMLGECMKAVCPERTLTGISFDPLSGAMYIHLTDGDVVQISAEVAAVNISLN